MKKNFNNTGGHYKILFQIMRFPSSVSVYLFPPWPCTRAHAILTEAQSENSGIFEPGGR